MRKLLYVILLLLFRLLMFPGAVCAEILSLPDSLIMDDNAYKYTCLLYTSDAADD